MAQPTLTPVFLSNSFMATFFHDVPLHVREKCLLFFGSREDEIFGKAGPDYDEFIRCKQTAGQFHSLKPPGWQEGLPCDFNVASQFLKANGFNTLHLDLAYYHKHLDLNRSVPEARDHLRKNVEAALVQISENLQEAADGTGCFGHDYGPILQMVQMADDRLFPILSNEGLVEFLNRVPSAAPPPCGLTPVFLSNSVLARFYDKVPEDVRDNCLLFFGSKETEIFGKAGTDYDEFIRKKQKAHQFHSLKPPGWKRGLPCDFNVASQFLQSNGFGPVHVDMTYYRQHLDLAKSIPEAQKHLAKDREGALKQIDVNFREAAAGDGYFGHDYGPVLQVVQMADDRLFPILAKEGLDEFLRRQSPLASVSA